MKQLRFAGGFVLVCALLMGQAAVASADPASETFIKTRHAQLTSVLREPASAAREASVSRELAGMVDYDVLVKRAFGEPCPSGAAAACTNHWAALTDAQKTQVRDLMRTLVEKNYKKNLTKTLDYELTIRRSTDANGESRVRTQAKSLTHPREAATTIDYIVVSSSGSPKVVDILTEGSSLTKGYYEQFHQMFTNPAQGYAFVVRRLNEKIAER